MRTGTSWIRWRIPEPRLHARARRGGLLLFPARADRPRAVTAAIRSCFAASAKHRVGVTVGAGRLDENRAVDPARVEQRPQIRRVEIASDHRVLGRHPRHRLPPEVPEMLVGIDRHIELASWTEDGEPPAPVGDAGGSSPSGGDNVLGWVSEPRHVGPRDERGAGVDVLRHGQETRSDRGMSSRRPRSASARSRVHQSSPTVSATSTHAGPSGNAYSSSDSGSISMLYPGAVGATYRPSRTTAGSRKCSCRWSTYSTTRFSSEPLTEM